MSVRSTLAVAATVIALPSAGMVRAEEELLIDRFAPPETFLVLSVPDWSEAIERAGETDLGALWETAEMRSFVEGVQEDLEAGFEEGFGDAGLEFEDLAWARGHVGLALSLHQGEDEEASPKAGFTLAADFGEDAARIERTMNELLDYAEDEDLIRITEDEEGGVVILTVERIGGETGEEDLEGIEGEFGGEIRLEPTPVIPDNPFDQGWLQIARLDTTLVVSSVRGVVGRALDARDGKLVEGPAEVREYQEGVAQLPAGADARLIAYMNGPVRKEIDALFEGLAMFLPGLDPGAVLEELGLSSVESVAMSLRFGADGGLLETVYAVRVPEKRGLVALADVSEGPFDPPAFVGVEAASVSRLMFDFPELLEVARRVIGTLDEQSRAQAEGMLGIVQPLVEPLLQNLGPEVWLIDTIERPLAMDSAQRITVIPVQDELVVSNTLVAIFNQMGVPMSAAEFEGGTIWTDEQGLFSVGLGLGHLFSGPGEEVRAAMRQAANPDTPRLSEEAAFRDATRELSREAVWYGFTAMGPTLEMMWWQFENANRIAYERIEESEFLDEETRREWLAEMSREPEEWVRDLPPVEVLVEHLGDVSGELVSTREGFRGRLVWLRARRE